MSIKDLLTHFWTGLHPHDIREDHYLIDIADLRAMTALVSVSAEESTSYQSDTALRWTQMARHIDEARNYSPNNDDRKMIAKMADTVRVISHVIEENHGALIVPIEKSLLWQLYPNTAHFEEVDAHHRKESPRWIEQGNVAWIVPTDKMRQQFDRAHDRMNVYPNDDFVCDVASAARHFQHRLVDYFRTHPEIGRDFERQAMDTQITTNPAENGQKFGGILLEL